MYVSRPLGYERVCLPLYKVEDTPFHIQGGEWEPKLPDYPVLLLFCRASDEPHAAVKPDGYVDNLLQAVDLFLQHKS